MKRKIIFPLLAFLISTSLAFPAPFVFAEAPTVTVTQSCSAQDSGGTVHEYSGQFLGICALVAAKSQGAVGSYTLAYDDAFGFYLVTLNGITPGSTEYWALYLNGGYASDGLSSMALTEGDIISFQLTDWSTNTDVGDPISFTVSLKTNSTIPEATGGQIVVTFNVPAALAFLANKQNVDGSFGSDFITDWAAIALASADSSSARNLVRSYLLSHNPSLTNTTDYERHAMALMALGIDPYIGTSRDYITPIVDAFDGTQIGSPSLVNDDIFALFPLPKAGYDVDSDIVQKTLSFILNKQGADGSWEGSVDLTAAAIQALAPFSSAGEVSSAIEKAKNYLHGSRRPDGSWANSFEASWVVQALHALGVSISAWIQDGLSPMSTLASAQEADGGVEPTTREELMRVWATSYAIPAALAKPWNDILKPFSKPTTTGIVLGVSTTTIATTTNETVATTTNGIVEVPEKKEVIAPAPKTTAEKNIVVEEEEEIAEVIEPTLGTTTLQMAAASTAIPSNFIPFFIIPFLLVLAALFGAFGLIPILRWLQQLFFVR